MVDLCHGRVFNFKSVVNWLDLQICDEVIFVSMMGGGTLSIVYLGVVLF